MNALQELREQVRSESVADGRDETWKYTNPAHLNANDFCQVSRQQIAEGSLFSDVRAQVRSHIDEQVRLNGKTWAALLVFINGFYFHELSDVRGVSTEQMEIHSIHDLMTGATSQAHPDSNGVSGLASQAAQLSRKFSPMDERIALENRALFRDGVWVRVHGGNSIGGVVQILQFASNAGAPGRNIAGFVRNIFDIENGAELKLVQNYVSLHDEPHLTNTVNDIYLSNDARITFCCVSRENTKSFNLSSTRVKQGRASFFHSTQLSLGNAIARANIFVEAADEATETHLNALSLASSHQHIDHFTDVNQAYPFGVTCQQYKGILSEHARLVFRGRIRIAPGALHTNVSQLSNNLLLSSQAEADVVPQLEIYADDVKATHGATVGQMNDEELFYLESRAVDADRAKQMILRGFAEDTLQKIPAADVAELARAAVVQSLEEVNRGKL